LEFSYKRKHSNSGDPINGHMFHDIGFEGVEIGIKAANAEHNSFIGGGFESQGCSVCNRS
jgi:hypothetical protein